jgi:putative tryptophan/tyrosine transport system substrate-binding protein
MDRRAFISGLTGILSVPLDAEAQQAGRVWRIGIIDPGGPNLSEQPTFTGFLQELHDGGYVVGQNIMIEHRKTDRPEKLQTYADELVTLGVNLIITGGTPPTHAAKQATSTIPIVFYNVGDPVGSRLVATLSRPGGNLTGLTHMSKEINSKRVELLKETVPSLSRLGVLAGPGTSRCQILRTPPVRWVSGQQLGGHRVPVTSRAPLRKW